MTLDLHTPFRENIPAYAIGALDGEDVVALEAHLKDCASCRTELAEYRTLSDSLLTAIPPAQPSAALRKQLQSRLPSAKKTSRPRISWSFNQFALGASLILLLAMNMYSIWQVGSLQSAQTQLNRQIRTGQTVMSMLSYPTTERLAINSDEAVGSILVDKDRDIVAVIIWDLPKLPKDETYQIWLTDRQGNRISSGLFLSDGEEPYTTKIVYPKQSLSDFTAVGVTVEPAGGSAQPTGERIFKVDF